MSKGVFPGQPVPSSYAPAIVEHAQKLLQEEAAEDTEVLLRLALESAKREASNSACLHQQMLDTAINRHALFNSGRYDMLVGGNKDSGAILADVRLQFQTKQEKNTLELPADDVMGITRVASEGYLRIHPLVLASLLNQEACVKALLPLCRYWFCFS